MPSAPSLSEAPPNNDESRNGSNLPATGSPESQSAPPHGGHPHEHDRHNGSASPPVRKDTISSTSTTATTSTDATVTSNDTTATALSIESPSHSYHGQAVFSAAGGDPILTPHRINSSLRPSRRRTGPLSAEQRERAALIRKLRACPDCRRRRVAVSNGASFVILEFDLLTFVIVRPAAPWHHLGRGHCEVQASQSYHAAACARLSIWAQAQPFCVVDRFCAVRLPRPAGDGLGFHAKPSTRARHIQ